MLTFRKSGYLLLEAILASAIISSAILFRSQIELKHKQIDQVKELASDVVKIPYAIDKRTLLDGHTLNLPTTSFTGAQDTVQNFLEVSLIGDSSAACSGGWSPVDAANGAMNLIPCNLFNYGKMPFKMDMDGAYELTPDGTIRSYGIELYHASDAAFDKHSSVYSQLVNYARIMDAPQMTGTHKYYLVNKGSGAELTPSECQLAKSQCAFRAEYSTNYVGMGEDPYLRVNGSNFMRGDIRFQGVGSATLACTKIKDDGVASDAECGLDYDQPSQDLSVLARSAHSEKFYLANNTIKNSTGSFIPVSCVVSSGTSVACGLTLLKNPSDPSKVISRAALHEISVGGSIYTVSDSKKTFEVDAETGNVKTKGSLTVEENASIKSENSQQQMILDNTQIHFNGVIPTLQDTDIFAKTTNTSKSQQLANQLVTKGYLHSFNQIIDIKSGKSGKSYNLYACPDGKYAEVIGFPAKSTLLMSQNQIDQVCPYVKGKRLPEIKLGLQLRMPTKTSIEGSVSMEYNIGCRWEGDYAQAWFMNVNGGKFSPRFYLISPRKYGTNNTANIEVEMDFMMIQYCGQGGLSTK
ncbi:hypothetical protein [Photobacterium galatheae]|uniref:Uncharacterized protein n=1 Tax=Photobacterium galatheae TaxID=1654360 RepID=A0A066RLE4_9GAMM|nr:hypothetical protein [Photobacterium galatheae]KDM89961.1 hypothetical protein EA58_19650 [Photobacterium galatheae]MCM0149244.1 hypothetical protein [Photobacterium galatheae]